MSDPRQLALLSEISQDRRDAAGRRLGNAITLHAESAARLDLLLHYREDYRLRLSEGAARGVTGDELRNFREFLERLEQAIAQQRAEVETLARGVDECRGRWLAERKRGLSYDVLAERATSAEREREARLLQKQVDEFSGRRALLRAAG
jgi:flagellar FliJ protein